MPQITRRQWLSTCFLSLGAAALLQQSGRVRAAPALTPRRMVLVFNSGGWDPTYALDPKPGVGGIDAPGGTVQSFGDLSILTDPSRPAIAAYFQAHASISAVVNGIQINSVAHPDGSRRILTGSSFDGAPDVAAISSAVHGADMAVPYLILGRTAYSGPYGALAARTGSVNQVSTLLNPSASFPVEGGALLPHIPTSAEEKLIRAHVLVRAERELAAAGGNHRIDDFIQSLDRADLLREIGLSSELELSRSFAAQVDIAVEAMGRGLCHSVQIETGDWDTHTDNSAQGPLHNNFFAGLKQLIDGLAQRSGSTAGSRLLDETVVVVASELGRTPRLNSDQGKDHWPVTSAMVIGAGVAGGRTIGATTNNLSAAGVDLATGQPQQDGAPILYSNFGAGVLTLTGVNASDYILGASPLGALQA